MSIERRAYYECLASASFVVCGYSCFLGPLLLPHRRRQRHIISREARRISHVRLKMRINHFRWRGSNAPLSMIIMVDSGDFVSIAIWLPQACLILGISIAAMPRE